MAGGTFSAMDKVIPGVYFNTQNSEAPASLLVPDGILAWVAPQTWGDDIVYISLDDYARDKCYLKIGRHNTDDYMQIFARYCNTLVCVNPSKDRVKAEADINDDLKAIAKFPGSFGNRISLVVVDSIGGKREVRTTVDGIVVDKQRVSSWASFKDNDFVVLEGTKSVQPELTSAINLAGGNDGTNEADTLEGEIKEGAKYVSLTDNLNVDGMVINVIDGEDSKKRLQLVRGEDIIDTFEESFNITTAPLAPVFKLADGNELALKAVDDDGEALSVLDLTSVDSIELSGGNHGYIAGLGLASDFLREAMFSVVVTADQSEVVRDEVARIVEDLAFNSGKFRRAVVCDKQEYPLIENRYNTDLVTYLGQYMLDDGESKTAYAIAAMEAGAGWNESITYAPVPLSGDPNVKLSDAQLEEWIAQGILCISKREDGVWCVTKDINSLHNLADNMSNIMKKNRATRLLNSLRNTTKLVWETQFAGKITNDDSGRSLWKSKFLEILGAYSDGRGIEIVDPASVVVMKGDDDDEVVTQCAIKILDSAEILYVTIIL